MCKKTNKLSKKKQQKETAKKQQLKIKIDRSIDS